MQDFHVHTKPGCPQCVRAKAALEARGYAYVETTYVTPEQIECYKEELGFRSFPMIFHGRELIGTADQLMSYLAAIPQIDDDF